MTNSISALILDFGGVLLRTTNRDVRRDIDQQLGLPPGALETFVFNSDQGQAAQLGTQTWDGVWQAAKTHFGLTTAQCQAAQAQFFGGDELNRELIGVIRTLKSRYTIGLLSNTWHKDGFSLLLQYGIADAFHFAVTSAGAGIMKPDARIYQTALAQAGASATAAVFIDDFPHNVQAAQALGMQAILFVENEPTLTKLYSLLNHEL